MNDWKQWYEATFPDGDPIVTGDETAGGVISTAEILDEIDLVSYSDVMHGQRVFQTANCAKCHRCNGTGNAIGPELTNLASRYSTREMVEAIINPDAHVASRYRSSIVQLTDGRQVEGMTAQDIDDSLVVLLANGDRVRYAAHEVEATRVTKTSPMPTGSIDDLTAQEISDLLSFMGDVSRTAKAPQTLLR